MMQCVPNMTRGDAKIAALAKPLAQVTFNCIIPNCPASRRDLDLSPGPLQGVEMAMLAHC